MNYTPHDLETLARTIYGEARGETDTGMIAVGCVAVNRARIALAWVAKHGRPHPLFGDGSVRSACLAPWQFSSWNENDPNRAKLLAVSLDDPLMARCVQAARAAIDLPDITHGSTHYYATSMAEPPTWALNHTAAAHIGHHLFFNNIQ